MALQRALAAKEHKLAAKELKLAAALKAAASREADLLDLRYMIVCGHI